jgi:ketosteroid isomerase-like protein
MLALAGSALALLPVRSLTGGLILACLLIAQPVSANPRKTQEILDRHVAAVLAGDVDAIMADYHKNAVLIAGDGSVHEGRDAIGDLFTLVLDACGSIDMELSESVVHGQIGYIQYTWPEEADYASDFYLIKGGQIRVQSICMFPSSDSCLLSLFP